MNFEFETEPPEALGPRHEGHAQGLEGGAEEEEEEVDDNDAEVEEGYGFDIVGAVDLAVECEYEVAEDVGVTTVPTL